MHHEGACAVRGNISMRPAKFLKSTCQDMFFQVEYLWIWIQPLLVLGHRLASHQLQATHTNL